MFIGTCQRLHRCPQDCEALGLMLVDGFSRVCVVSGREIRADLLAEARAPLRDR